MKKLFKIFGGSFLGYAIYDCNTQEKILIRNLRTLNCGY